MTIKDALLKGAYELSKSVKSPKKEAIILLKEFLQKDESFLMAHDDENVPNIDCFFEWIKRRVNHTPLEYITQKASFYSHEFIIKEGVLVPRPETEILVDKASELIEEFRLSKIAEIGVGSGVISTILALKFPNAQISATDISIDAIELSKINAKKFGVYDRMRFYLSSYLDGLETTPNIVVSNPPYVSKKERLEEHVLNEPHSALFGGEQGDEILKDIILLVKNRGIPFLVCEMGYDQKDSIETFFFDQNIKNYSFYKDLSGLDRGFIVKG